MDLIKKLYIIKQGITEKQLRLKLKTTIFTSVAASIFFTILIALTYYLGFTLLLDKGAEAQKEMARTLASSVDSTMEKQLELLKLNANSQSIVTALKENNLKYRTKGEREIARYLMDVDKRWIEAPDDHPIIKEYLGNKISAKLNELKVENEKLINITVADKFGGMAGSTSRTSGFYSFDKDWWLSSYAKGHGKPFIGGVEYDEHSNSWCLPFAVPIEDETGAVVGICKASVNIDVFFKPLADFKIGRTGNAVLADDKAYLVYHQKASPYANKFCEYSELQKTLQSGEMWGVLSTAYLNRGKKLVGFYEVNLPPLLTKGVNWFVFVERDFSEIFSPLKKLIFVMILIGIALTIILALSVFILSGQETPASVLQVIKDSAPVKAEEENPLERRTKQLPQDTQDK